MENQKEYFIILPEMILRGPFKCWPLMRQNLICQIGRLVEGGKSADEYVPDGYGVEEVPGEYKLTNLIDNTSIQIPLLLEKCWNKYKSVSLTSTPQGEKVLGWENISNAIGNTGYCSLEKIN